MSEQPMPCPHCRAQPVIAGITRFLVNCRTRKCPGSKWRRGLPSRAAAIGVWNIGVRHKEANPHG